MTAVKVFFLIILAIKPSGCGLVNKTALNIKKKKSVLLPLQLSSKLESP
jgi:hypothetical protein